MFDLLKNNGPIQVNVQGLFNTPTKKMTVEEWLQAENNIKQLKDYFRLLRVLKKPRNAEIREFKKNNPQFA